MKVYPIEEEAVQRIAKILGDSSAAAMCLKEAEARRARGEPVAFYRGRGRHDRVLIVADPVTETPSESGSVERG